MTRETKSLYLRMPIGHSIKAFGRLQTTTELFLPLGISPNQDQTRTIYLRAITADNFIYRRKELFGQTQFT